MSAVLPVCPTTPCPGQPFSFQIAASSTGGPIQAFGFNLAITSPAIAGSPGTILAVVPAPGIQMQRAIAGNQVAVLGAPPAGLAAVVPSPMATVVFSPAAALAPGDALNITFGGTTALPSGIIPVNHLVVAGCDVHAGSVPPLAVAGLALVMAACPGGFIRGDCNNNGFVGGFLGDPIFLLNNLFAGGPAPACPAACDFDDSDSLFINDAILFFNWVFQGGPPPGCPFPPVPLPIQFLGCGPDPTPGVLGCAAPVCP